MSDLNLEINKAEKEALLEKYKTAMKKAQFVQELKNGLGAEIKKGPNKVRQIKKTWYQKMILRLRNIFTKF